MPHDDALRAAVAQSIYDARPGPCLPFRGLGEWSQKMFLADADAAIDAVLAHQIGRASWRERV